jgi:hypothetical protein
MKRIFVALGFFSILFTLTSCQKDQNFIRASITRYHGAEKVHLDANNYACWDGDETIWINGGASEYPITTIEGDPDHFMIDMGSTTLTSGTVLNAVFHPSTVTLGDYSSTDNTIGITLPDEQTYSEVNGDQVINAPMVAKATVNSQGGAELVFSNACALLKVQLRPQVICYWIEVTSSNAPLAGNGRLDIDDASLTMTGTTRTVRLKVNDVNNPRYCRADGVYYIVLPPYMGSNLTSKLTVTVYDNPKTVMTFSQSNGHNLSAGEIGVVDVASYDLGRGIFSVDANGTIVSFAPGNLQINPYKFTTNQEDCAPLTYNSSNAATYSGAMGSYFCNLTSAQWCYLLNFNINNDPNFQGRVDEITVNGETVQKELKARARVNGVNGLLLLPDGWFKPTSEGGMGLGSVYPIEDVNSSDSYGDNAYSGDAWKALESYGVVFLPAITSTHENRNYYYTGTTGQIMVFGEGVGYPVGGVGEVGAEVSQINTAGGGAQVRLAHIIPQGE